MGTHEALASKSIASFETEHDFSRAEKSHREIIGLVAAELDSFDK